MPASITQPLLFSQDSKKALLHFLKENTLKKRSTQFQLILVEHLTISSINKPVENLRMDCTTSWWVPLSQTSKPASGYIHLFSFISLIFDIFRYILSFSKTNICWCWCCDDPSNNTMMSYTRRSVPWSLGRSFFVHLIRCSEWIKVEMKLHRSATAK